MSFNGYEYKFKLNASHFIDFLHPETIHSHTFHINFYLENRNEEFITYTEIEKNISEYLSKYVGKCINFVYPFDKIVPTLENICKEIYQNIEEYCNSIGVVLTKIEISDNSLSWYSMGNSILIDSINETIDKNKINEYIKTNNYIKKYMNNIEDKLKEDDLEKYLNSYLNKEDVHLDVNPNMIPPFPANIKITKI